LPDRGFTHKKDHFGKHLPAGLTGQTIAAILAAGTSTVSTPLHFAATVLQAGIFLRLLRP